MNSIDELALQENNLLAKVHSFEGLMEEKSAQIQSAGIFSAYTKIYEQYTDFAIQEHDLEAVKRALFLQWYAQSEPSCFTGLFGFSKNTQLQVLTIVDLFLAKERGDLELTCMIEWYYQISNWYFDFYLEDSNNLRYLKTMLQKTRSQQNIAERFRAFASTISGRGQMSNYWESIIRSSNTITNG